jgi:hypothetical protein
MPNVPPLRPADPAEVADALAYALRYDGKWRVYHADDAMARITAERLIRHLEQAGFVLMRKAPGAAPTTSSMPSSIG